MRTRFATVVALALPLILLRHDLARSQDDDEEEPAPGEAVRPLRQRPQLTGPARLADEAERGAWLAATIDNAIELQRVLGRARIGIAVVDVVSGRTLYAHNADQRFNAASNTKIVTAIAALALLGPDFRYQTALYARELTPQGAVRGDLHLVGRGDPSFDTRAVYDLVNDLTVAGVRRVDGGLVIDASYFDADNLPPHFDEQPDEHAAFRAPIGAVSLNFNGLSVVVRPGARRGAAAALALDPANDFARLTGRVTTVARGRTRVQVKTTETANGTELRVIGQIRLDAEPVRIRRRVSDPVKYVGTAFLRAMRERGIRVGRADVRLGEVPLDARRLARTASRPIATLVRGLGKYSNNFVAETMVKTIGAEVAAAPGEPGTWAGGLDAVRGYLSDALGIPPDSFRYDNGSGLFESNAFTPGQLATLLAAGYQDFRFGPELVASLAFAGVDGTLRDRLTDGPAERQVRAKTGTLATVSALSGYAAVDSARPLAFSVLLNDIPRGRGTLRAARDLQDDIAEALVLFARRAR